MIFIVLLYIALVSSSLSKETNSHILVIAPPMFSHIIPSLELAKQLSTHCHVTFLISTNKVKELEHKGLINVFNSSNTLDIVGLNDGNNESLEFQLQDSQINLNNITQAVTNDSQNFVFNAVINRMGSALNQLFRSNVSICSPSSIPSCSLKLSSSQSLTTRPISRPINMIIARSITPLPLFNLSIPFYLFLPSNLQGVVGYLLTQKANDSHQPAAFSVHLQNNIYRANGFICNSLKEFDEKYVDEFYRLTGNQAPIHFVGPIIFDGQKSTESKAKEIINWLDKQPVASVIYIAFGSVVRLPPSAIDTIAKALSHYSFIWSLKTEQSFPSSLKNLDSHRQLILEWTPQRAILAHPSVSFFFSHGGWNSLIEGMLHGKAILVWPFFSDQFGNALQLVDMGMARQVSVNLQMDIEHMLTNNNYTNQAKQIQQMVIKARENNSKEQIANIIQLISNKEQHHEEF